MANRGSGTHTLGDPIYAIEVKYGNGDTMVKTFPSLSGLKSGLKAVDSDIAHWAKWKGTITAQGWVPVSREVYITKPRWHLFDPNNP